MKTKKCAFTGHRPQSLPFGFNEADERCIALKQKLRDEIIRQIEENGITLECAIPCETQAEKWSEALRDRYFDIASKCDKETLLQQRYTPDCMHKRNRYMVDQADYIIAVWNGKPSGTGKTVQYAQQQGKPVRVINPITLVVENI